MHIFRVVFIAELLFEQNNEEFVFVPQSKLVLHVIVSFIIGVFVHDDCNVPGLWQISWVDTLLSSQSKSESHLIHVPEVQANWQILTTGEFTSEVQKLFVVPGLLHVKFM